MSDAPATKFCTDCGKDVTLVKRKKDARGHYYCEACAAQRAAPSAAPAPAAAAPPPSASDNSYDLAPAEAPPPKPAPKPALKPTVAKPAPTAATASTPQPPAAQKNTSTKLPARCPSCDTPVLTQSKICVKCQRDVTQSSNIEAIKKAAAPDAKLERTALLVGRTVKAALVVFCVGVVAFILYGMYLSFVPGGTFDGYPTSREAAIRDYCKHIATGTPKSFEKAFILISFRERITNNPDEESLYTAAFQKNHDDFAKKYGPDWPTKMTIKEVGPILSSMDDEHEHAIQIGNDRYLITTQVQIAVDQSIANIASLRHRPTYPEGGKNRFGVLELEGYRVHKRDPKGSMLAPDDPNPPLPP